MKPCIVTLTGVVRHSHWVEGTVSARRSKIEPIGDRLLLTSEYRVMRKGLKYRTEMLDGNPVRIFDGQRVWNFYYEESDFGYAPGPVVPVLREDSAIIPYIFPLPPRPVEAEPAPALPPLSSSEIEYKGQQVLQVVRPLSQEEPNTPGYTHLFDKVTGFLIRSTFGADQSSGVEWRDVVTGMELPDELFVWTGPVRHLHLEPDSG